MTHSEQKDMVKAMTGEKDAEVLSTYLRLAGCKITARAYPYSSGEKPVPERYHYLQVEIAAYMLNKRGAEGQTGHSENGISRSYENGDVPESMLSTITPMCEVVM